MGDIRLPEPVLLLIVVCSRHHELLDWARRVAVEEFGPVALESAPFDFVETNYYQATMGTDLKKQILAFCQLIDPSQLADIKRLTNRWELECGETSEYPEPRPLNLDPGYLSLAKLVLASTKDHAHRVYLGEGIYAEVTLQYSSGRWCRLDWTYPDYQREDYHKFFSACRQVLRAERSSAN